MATALKTADVMTGDKVATDSERLSDYVAVYKAAAALHKTPAAVKRKIEAGLVKAIRRGGCGLLVKVSDVEKAFLLDVHRAESASRVVPRARRKFQGIELNRAVRC